MNKFFIIFLFLFYLLGRDNVIESYKILMALVTIGIIIFVMKNNPVNRY